MNSSTEYLHNRPRFSVRAAHQGSRVPWERCLTLAASSLGVIPVVFLKCRGK